MASSEKEAALAAVPTDAPTVFRCGPLGEWRRGFSLVCGPATISVPGFDKILNKQFPSTVVYEDDKALAFRHIAPQAPTHILIMPKVKDGLTGISKVEQRHCEILGHLMYVTKLVAKQQGLDNGYRVVINDGPNGCQTVYHLHIHLFGGRQMNWPPG